MHNKIVKASPDSVIRVGFHPFDAPKSLLDDRNKMKLRAPGPSKAAQKNAKGIDNLAFTSNKL